MLGRLREFTRMMRAGANASVRSEQLLRRMLQIQLLAPLAASP